MTATPNDTAAKVYDIRSVRKIPPEVSILLVLVGIAIVAG